MKAILISKTWKWKVVKNSWSKDQILFCQHLEIQAKSQSENLRTKRQNEANYKIWGIFSWTKIHFLLKNSVVKFQYLSETVCLFSFRRRWGAGERKYVSLSYNETYYSGGFIRLGAKVNINVAKSRVSSRMMIIFLISLLKYKRNLACNLIILSFLYSDTN